MSIAWKIGRAIKPLSGHATLVFSPVTRSRVASRRYVDSYAENPLRTLAQRFISRDFNGLGRMAVERRLPPGQREVRKWPRLDLGIVPRFDPKEWDLRVDGSVDKPIRYTYDEFLRLPSAKVMSPFHCVTGWTTFDNEWVGVMVREVAERAQIRSTARFATFRCGDGYTTSHPLNVLYDSDVLLTYQWDGKPLPIEHGGPVRLLVPKRYAYKSAKWVPAVTFTDEEELGYWEVRGYSNTADPLTEDRYSFLFVSYVRKPHKQSPLGDDERVAGVA